MPIAEVRRANFIRLLARLETGPGRMNKKEVAAAMDVSASYLSGLIANPPRRPIGPEVARRIEERFGLPDGSLDEPRATVASTKSDATDGYLEISVHRARGGAGGAEQRMIDWPPVPQGWLERHGFDPERVTIVHATDDAHRDVVGVGEPMLVQRDYGDAFVDGLLYAIDDDGVTMLRRVRRKLGGRLELYCASGDYAPDIISREQAEALDVIGLCALALTSLTRR